MRTSKTLPRGGSYEIPYFSPEDLHATLDYLAGVLPTDADPVHRKRLENLRDMVDEQSLIMRELNVPAHTVRAAAS